MGFLKTILSFSLVFIAVAMANPSGARAEFGADIVGLNCNPNADPLFDGTKTAVDPDFPGIYPEKSCKGQNIKMEDFKVKVRFNPDADFVGRYVAINLATVLFRPIRQAIYWTGYNSVFVPGTAYCSLTALNPPALVLCEAGVVTAAEKVALGAVVTSVLVDLGLSLRRIDGKGVMYIAIAETKNMVESDLGPMAAATVSINGDKACVNLQARPFPFMNFAADRIPEFNTKYGIDPIPTATLAERAAYEQEKGMIPGSLILPSNCVPTPAPLISEKPSVPAFISKACLDYDASASQFNWPPTGNKDINDKLIPPKTRSFIGVVVQCVEDTMTNLFFNSHGDASGQSVFMKMQAQLQSYIMALLALYIIILGYKYGILERGGLKQKDFIWVIIKVSMVMFFASGSGMIQLLPGMIGSVKDLSGILLDAAAGTSANKVDAKATLSSATNAYNIAAAQYSLARKTWSFNKTDAALTTAMENAKVTMDAANTALQKARISTLSFGYDYCDFRPYVDAGKYNIETTFNEDTIVPYDAKKADGTFLKAGTTIPAGITVTRNMNHMHVWDTIDCRIAKYFGIGANAKAPNTPQFLLLATGMLLGGPVGIIIFALSIVFLVFTTLIIIRIVQVYIIAFIALILLVYISPLIFPLALFESTKSSFDKWLKHVIGYMVQPVILFGFLAIMFAVFDSIIWGDNYDFYPINKADLYNTPKLTDNSIQKVKPGGGDVKVVCTTEDTNPACACPDKNAIGCMYERFEVNKTSLTILNKEILTIYNVSEDATNHGLSLFSTSQHVAANDTSVKAGNLDEFLANPKSISNSGYLTDSERKTYMFGLMKAVFVCFIIHALLKQIEEIAATMTNVEGVARMATVPAARPDRVFQATVIPLGKMAFKIGRGAAAGAEKGYNDSKGSKDGGSAAKTLKNMAWGATKGALYKAPGVVAGAAVGAAKKAAVSMASSESSEKDDTITSSASNANHYNTKS